MVKYISLLLSKIADVRCIFSIPTLACLRKAIALLNPNRSKMMDISRPMLFRITLKQEIRLPVITFTTIFFQCQIFRKSVSFHKSQTDRFHSFAQWLHRYIAINTEKVPQNHYIICIMLSSPGN